MRRRLEGNVLKTGKGRFAEPREAGREKRLLRKTLPVLLAAVMVLGMAPAAMLPGQSARAAYTAEAANDLPNGWWPVWSAYQDAVKKGNTEDLLKKGDAVISFYSDKKMNNAIANQLYMVYLERMNRNIYEDRGDYAAAKNNLTRLKSVSEYLTANGENRDDMIKACQSRLELIDPQWGVYAVSNAQNNTYGSSVAAGSGTYYGAIYGSENFSEKTITSYYVELETETSAKYTGLISNRDDGTRVLLINLNFTGEGNTARAIPGGTYDNSIRTTFQHLNTLKSSVVVRIGGEMDVWTNAVSPADFIRAYRHIADIARQEAPDVELIFSPNYVSSWNVNAEDYYPGDAYVDWVGVSLYYNYASSGGSASSWIEYSKSERFMDPLRSMERVYRIAEKHNKPVIVTEGGAMRNSGNDGTGEAWTAAKTAKEYSTLNMVYPRVKAIVHFDRVAERGNDYRITGAVYNSTSKAMNENPALIQPGQTSAGSWVPVTAVNEPAGDSLLIGSSGMTYKSTDMSAVYKLDNGNSVSGAGSPNHFRVDLSKMQKGSNHRLDVTLSDGKGYTVSKTYTIAYLDNGYVRCFEGWRPTVFSDVKDDTFYLDPVKWAVKNGITNGTSDTTFSPDEICSRGQVVTFLWRASGSPEPESLKDPAGNPFRDVKESDYFYKAVLWAVEQGITNGTGDTTFSPGAECTRGHVVTFLWRAQKEPAPGSSSNPFADVKAGNYYYNAVLWAVEKSITNGTGEGTFSPDQFCTRGQIVTFLYRALA